MERTEVNARWQEQMTPFFPDLADGGRPDTGMQVLEQVFDLDAQLLATGLATTGE